MEDVGSIYVKWLPSGLKYRYFVDVLELDKQYYREYKLKRILKDESTSNI